MRYSPGSPSIQAVLFDIGGVFFPWPLPDFFESWKARLGISSERFQDLLWHGSDIEAANVGAITAEEYARRCAVRLGADPGEVLALIEAAYSGEQVNLGLVAYARALRPYVRVVAVTNTWSFGRTLLQRRGIADLFDLTVSSAEVGVRKPHEHIYRVTLEQLAIAPPEAEFVDDNWENVEAARALGIHGIQFVSTKRTIAELESILAQYGVVRDLGHECMCSQQ